MSRLSQVVQMGEVNENVHFYIEDYAYTYLKKQKGKEVPKYFLYGEQEKEGAIDKIFIYGIGEKPKLEQSYFKEYYPVGYLKIKQDKAYWISLKGKEEEITGCFLFYASNQAMQEYLIDHRQKDHEQEVAMPKRRKTIENELPVKEIWVSSRRLKSKRYQEEFKNEKFILPIGGIVIAVIALMILVSPNGRKKAEIMKEVIARTVSEMGVSVEDDFSIEEIEIIQNENYIEETMSADSVWDVKEDANEAEKKQEVVAEETISEKEDDKGEELQTDEKEQGEKDIEEVAQLDEYIVKVGDTLAGICKIRYGTTSKMKEICEINNIKNADYIAPGQKIYLP